MGIVNKFLKFSIIFTDSSNTIFQCFVYLHQNKVQRNIEKFKKNSFLFFCANKRKMDKAIKTFTLLFAGQSVSNDKLKSFFVDFCKNFMNISWFFAVIFRDFG